MDWLTEIRLSVDTNAGADEKQRGELHFHDSTDSKPKKDLRYSMGLKMFEALHVLNMG